MLHRSPAAEFREVSFEAFHHPASFRLIIAHPACLRKNWPARTALILPQTPPGNRAQAE